MLTLFVACALPREITKTPRSAIEQLLLTQALDRSLDELSLPLSSVEPLYVDVTGLQPGYLAPQIPLSPNSAVARSAEQSAALSGFFTPSSDLTFIKNAVAARLRKLGYRVTAHEEDATFVLHVIVQSFGTNQSSSFFGLPPIQSVIIPFALPQLTVYQDLAQDGYVRYGVDLVERASGRLSYTTRWYSHRTYHDQYTILFFVTFRRTDLDDAP